ncbi:MAG: ABC transporter permease [Ignavibacteriae bacterium]|nr:MAG: ABC transporter permease [Ignavibacteriota bacterium]
MLRELFRDFLYDLNAHRTRATLTLIAITWGTIAVVLLLSFGEGLGNQMLKGMLNAGNRIMIVSGGETGMVYQGLPKGRRIRPVEADVEILNQAIGGNGMISPQYRNGVTLTYGKYSQNTECEGVNPCFEEMRRMYPAVGGRFLNEVDVERQRRVLVLGTVIAKSIFKDEEPVGKSILLDGVPYTVVGIIQKKVQTAMNNGPDTRRAIIPYTTFRTTYGNIYVNSIVIQPGDPSRQQSVKTAIYEVLGRKYRFDPKDERALNIWDFIEAEKISQKVGLGVSIFLFSIGFLTLLIAGVGVANVMYVVVKERTREIGIKMAVGARRSYIMAQFIFESLLLALTGGAVGILFCYAVVSVVWMIPADEGAMQFLGRPVLSWSLILITVGILSAIGFAAGVFPARKAASVDPVESLRYE